MLQDFTIHKILLFTCHTNIFTIIFLSENLIDSLQHNESEMPYLRNQGNNDRSQVFRNHKQ